MSPLAREKCAVLPHYNVAFPCLTHKRKPASTACQSFMSWATASARTCFHSALDMKIVTDWRISRCGIFFAITRMLAYCVAACQINHCLLVSAKDFSDEKAKTGKILVDANSDRRYARIMEQDQAIMKTNRDLIGHVKAVLAESTGVDETQSAHLLRCTTCGAPSDGWPDSNPTTHGELCQDCWEAECSESWWRMVNRFPGAAYPVDELESTPES